MLRLLLCLLMLLLPLHAQAWHKGTAQRTDHSTAQLITSSATYEQSQIFWVALHLDLDEGWHSYWHYAGDSGFAPTLHWTLPEGYTASAIHYPLPHRYELSELITYGYSDDAYYLVRITPPHGVSHVDHLKVRAEWLVCNAEQCVPESAELALDVAASTIPPTTDADFTKIIASIPKPHNDAPPHFRILNQEVILQLPRSFYDARTPPTAFFPSDDSVISNHPAITWIDTKEGWQGRALLSKTAKQPQRFPFVVQLGDTILELRAQHDERLTPAHNATSVPAPSITWIIAVLLAFGGGTLLNFMPCVLPILSLKIFSLIKHQHDPNARRESIRHALAYTGGVVASFLIIAATLLALRSAGHALGWGFQLQHPLFIALLAWLMLMVGWNLSGLFHLPSITLSGGASTTSSYRTSAMTGLLAVVVATPCTAPLMAPALGFALTQSPFIVLMIFTALALGMAAPFLLISTIPALGRFLPKSGAWMQRFKEFLAFPMYATSAWLLWVLARQAGLDALALWLALAILSAFWLWLGHGNNHTMRTWGGLSLSLFSILWLLHSMDNTAPATLNATPYNAEQLEAWRAKDEPVFIYATADWCITCKYNERTTLRDSAVQHALTQRKVHVMVADWTRHDASITTFLQQHGRAGVPLYVYYPPHADAVVLPQIITPSSIVGLLEAL